VSLKQQTLKKKQRLSTIRLSTAVVLVLVQSVQVPGEVDLLLLIFIKFIL